MYDIVVKRCGFEYKYFCRDEQSITYLFRRLKECYEYDHALTEKVTMTIKKEDDFYTIKDNRVEKAVADTVTIIAEWGLQ